MSAGFEVVQAKIYGWVTPSSMDIHNAFGVFFELYPLVKQRQCRCWKERRRKPTVTKCSSDVVEEASEMLYRKQEDGISTALGTFPGTNLRAKKGEDVRLVMDLFRTSMDDGPCFVSEPSGSRIGHKVASLSGAFRVGAWGDVTLIPTGLPQLMQDCGVDMSEFKAVLELRPVSSRPFMLANAKPRTERAFSIEAFIQDGNHSGGRPKPSTRTGLHRLSLGWSNDGTSSQSNLLSWNRRSGSTLGTPSDKPLHSTSIANFRPSKKDNVARFCLAWVPDNWAKFWSSIWPEQQENLMGKHEIVPLMEAEFRRDCVVFYNTLFPRCRRHSFRALRDAALEPTSKVCFKILTGKLSAKVKAIIDTSRMQVHELQWTPSLALISASKHSLLDYSGGSSCSHYASIQSEEELVENDPDSSRSFTLAEPTDSTGELPSRAIKTSTQTQLPRSEDVPQRLSRYSGGTRSTTNSTKTFNGHASESPTKEDSTHNSAESAILISVDDVPIARPTPKRLRTRTQTLSRENPKEAIKESIKYTSNSAATTMTGVQSISSRSHLLSSNHSIGIMRGLAAPHGVFLDEYSPRIALMKRLFICFAHCGVHYSEVVDSSEIGDPWPYPLAAVLGHGCRILIRLEDIEGHEFLNFLLTGDPYATDWKADGVPLPLKQRSGATHSVSIETETGRLFERKLRVTSASDMGTTIMDGMKKKHLGLDLPIGGVGNPSPLGGTHAVGFRGEIYQIGTNEHNADKNTQSFAGKLGHFAMNFASRGSLDSLARPWSSDASNEQGDGGFCKNVPEMQGGHMYIRIDDFGVQRSSSWAERDHEPSKNQEKLKALREKPAVDKLSIRIIDMLRKVAKHNNTAGELLFPSHFEHLYKRQRRLNAQSRGTSSPLALLRVNSEPALISEESVGTEEDRCWVREVIFHAHHCVSLDPPPSALALKLLFAHYDAQSAELYGTASFKSFEDLFAELKDSKSYIVKHGQGIRRRVQPTIVQLCWKHLVLILRYELPSGRESAVEKNSFIATVTRHQETWTQAARRAIREELGIEPEVEQAMMGDLTNGHEDKLHSSSSTHTDKSMHEKTISEKTTSPSYPGLLCEYRTHMVHYQIHAHFEDAWKRFGFIGDAKRTPDASRFGCDFVTMKNKKRLYWQWVPRPEAQQMQKFLNMGEDTLDERWAKYAYQANGIVRYPPSEAALAILLRRCGIDILKFGTDSYKPLRDFWVELTNEESYLHMSSGRPVRVAEALFVKVRWQPEENMDWVVLVQVSEQKVDGKVKDTKKLLSTRKGKSETWEDSAIRCVVQDLCVSKSQLKNMLAHKTNAASGYLFYEEKLKETVSYPGIQGSYRTHLVTFNLRENFQIFVHPTSGGKLNKLNSTTSFPSLSKVGRSAPEANEITEVTRCDNYYWRTKRTTPIGVKTLEFEWVAQDKLYGVKGVDLWKIAEDKQEHRHVCSVLLGLEGAGPQKKSPFGGTHDMSGKPKPISAVGNHKWSVFRLNNAVQVPSDENGMRMRITRQSFHTLRKVCSKIDLMDPVLDILTNSQQTHDREYLNQMYAEREFFKNLLSSNASQAKEILRWMLDHRRSCPTLAQRAANVVSTSGPPRTEAHHFCL